MFYLNLGYQWAIPPIDGLGVTIAANGVTASTAFTKGSRADLPTETLRLFDPQLYLNGINFIGNEALTKRLSSYPWINPSIDSTKNISDWADQVSEDIEGLWPYQLIQERAGLRQAISSCINFQIQFGVSKILLPGPLTNNPETDFSTEMEWIDAGLDVIPSDNELPIFATLAISDSCLINLNPNESELLALIIDQVTSRENLDGIYFVLEQSAPITDKYSIRPNVAWSILSLCYDIAHRAGMRLIVNYLDVFGLACFAVGAEGFCSGPTTKLRRLSYSDFNQQGFGLPLPRLYSHSLIMDLFPIRDIEEKIHSKRLTRYITGDRTNSSATLFEALETNQPVENIDDWFERPNNVRTCRNHYIERLDLATKKLAESQDKVSEVLTWFQDAERDADYLVRRFETDPLSADHRHIKVWRSAFEKFIDQYGL